MEQNIDLFYKDIDVLFLYVFALLELHFDNDVKWCEVVRIYFIIIMRFI